MKGGEVTERKGKGVPPAKSYGVWNKNWTEGFDIAEKAPRIGFGVLAKIRDRVRVRAWIRPGLPSWRWPRPGRGPGRELGSVSRLGRWPRLRPWMQSAIPSQTDTPYTDVRQILASVLILLTCRNLEILFLPLRWQYFLITIPSCIYGNVHQRAQSWPVGLLGFKNSCMLISIFYTRLYLQNCCCCPP